MVMKEVVLQVKQEDGNAETLEHVLAETRRMAAEGVHVIEDTPPSKKLKSKGLAFDIEDFDFDVEAELAAMIDDEPQGNRDED